MLKEKCIPALHHKNDSDSPLVNGHRDDDDLQAAPRYSRASCTRSLRDEEQISRNRRQDAHEFHRDEAEQRLVDDELVHHSESTAEDAASPDNVLASADFFDNRLMRGRRSPRSHGLAAWQVLTAKTFLGQNLDDSRPISRAAAECGLSSGYFARMFKEVVGLPPHRWLIKKRIDAALVLLRNSDLPLSEIALECGFCEQAHMCRVFRKWLATTPAAMRKERGNAGTDLRIRPEISSTD